MNGIRRKVQRIIAFFMTICMLFLNGTVGWAAPLVDEPKNIVIEQPAEDSEIEVTKKPQLEEALKEEVVVQTEEVPETEAVVTVPEEALNRTSELYTDDQIKALKGAIAPSGRSAGLLVENSPLSIGGNTGDYLKLVFDKGDTSVGYKEQATMEVFKDVNAGTGNPPNWQFQYYDKNSSGIALHYTIGGVTRQYTTPYIKNWTGNRNVQLLTTADAVITKVSESVFNVKWTKPDFTFEMVYTYLPGTLSFTRDFYFSNKSGQFINNIKLIYGGDTYFGGNDYGYSYWNPDLNMVYVRSSSGDPSFMGISGSSATPANAYFGGPYNVGVSAANNGNLPNTVTASNEDQSYYLQWNRSALSSGSSFNVMSTERFSVGGKLQLINPEYQSVYQSGVNQVVTYKFLAVNVDVIPITVNFSALSAKGYPVTVTTPSVVIPANSQTSVEVKVTIPPGATVGEDKLTLTGKIMATGISSSSNVVTTIMAPPDTAVPVISNISYTPNRDWSNTDVVVKFNVTDEGGSGVKESEVKVKDPTGADVIVTKAADGSYHFLASITGIYTISAKDNIGNTAVLAYTKKINIDKSAPIIQDIRIGKIGSSETTSILNTETYNYFTNTNSEITVFASDSLSGISTIDYQFVAENGVVNEASWINRNFTDLVNPRSYTFQAEPDRSLIVQGTFVGKVYIRVKDSGGNEIRSSISLNGKYVNENINPSVALMTPVDVALDLTKWHSGIDFNLSATDAESGLSRIEIYNGDTLVKTVTLPSKTNGLGQTTYDTKVLTPAEHYTVTTPGQYDVYLKAYDKSGNVHKSNVQRVKICNAIPILNVTPETGNWTNQNSVLTLSNQEVQVNSPITYYYQKTGETAWTKIGTVGPHSSITFTLSGSENTTYSFQAVTETNKESSIVTKIIKIDKEVPKPATIDTKIESTGILNTPNGSNNWYVETPTLNITSPTAVGELSSVKTKYRFSLSSDFITAPVIDYSGTNPVITADGVYKIELYTVDEAGNESPHTTREIKVDTNKPQIDGIALRNPENSFIGIIELIWNLFTGKTGVDIAGSDLTSGVGEVYYQAVDQDQGYDENGTWIKASGMEIAPQFKGSVYAKVIDNAGNWTIKESEKLISDGQKPTAPTVTMKTEVGPYDGSQWTSQKITLTVSSSTALSGIKEYVYGVKQENGEYTYTTLPISPEGTITFDAPENGQTDYEIYGVSQTNVSSEKIHVTTKCDIVSPSILVEARSTAWTNGNVTILLSGSVGSSGLKSLIFKRDETTVDITSLIHLTQEGLNTVFAGNFVGTQNGDYKFIITNGAGVEKTAVCEIRNIDRDQPPLPTYNIRGTMGSNGWYKEVAPVIVMDEPIQDNGSPINNFYKLHEADTAEPSEIKVTDETNHLTVKEGIYNFNLRAEDGAFNKVRVGTQQIKVDTIKPELEMEFDESVPESGVFENGTVINFKTTETGSGVWYIAYTLSPKNGEEKTSYIAVDLSGKTQIHVWAPFVGTVSAQVYDRAGNISEIKKLDCNIAAAVANTRVEATINSAPYYGAWTNQSVRFKLSNANLVESSVKRYQISLNGTEWLEFGDEAITLLGEYDSTNHIFTTKTDQTQTYSFRVVTQVTGTTDDVLGIPVGPMTVRVDTVIPRIDAIHFTGVAIENNVYKDTVLFTIDSSDYASGIKKIEYSLDDGVTWHLYNGETAINPQFKGWVNVRVTDGAGNVSSVEKSQEVTVDQARPTAPTIEGKANQTNYQSDTWTQNAPVSLEMSGGGSTDPAFSGIHHYTYTVDGGNTWIVLDKGVTTIEASTLGTTIYRVRAVSNTGVEGDATRFIVKIDTNKADIHVIASNNMSGWQGPDGFTNQTMSYKLSTTYTGPSPYDYYVRTNNSGDFVKITGDTFTTIGDNVNTYVFQIKTESGKTVDSAEFISRIDRVNPKEAPITLSDPDGTNGWYKTYNAPVIASSDKDTDEVERSPITTYYTLGKDGGAVSEINLTGGQPTIGADGQYVLKSYARDAVGNTSSTTSKTLKVDTGIPRIDKVEFSESKIMDIVSGLTFGLYNKTISVEILASDVTSGVQKIEYRLVPEGTSDAGWETYNGFYISPQFKGTLYTRVVDNAGNISAETTSNLMLDAEVPKAPTVHGVVGGNPYTEKTWISTEVILTSSGSDVLSGVKYQYNDGSDDTWHDVPVGGMVVNKEGQTIFMIRAVSNAGIVSPSTPFEVWRDTALPIVTVTAKDSDGQDYAGDWTSKSVVYTISGANPSGMYFYQSNDKENWIELTDAVPDDQTTFTLNQDTNGEQTLYFKGITGTGLEAAEPISKIAKIDKTEPAIPEITATPPDGLAGWYKTSGTITVTPSEKDQDGGIRSEIKTYYKVGSEEEMMYTTPLMFPTVDGVYRYSLRAKDAVDNVSLGTSGVQIHYDQTAPTIKNIAFYDLEGKKIEKIVGSEDQGYFTNAAVYVTVLGNDNLSGMRSIEYYTETVDGLQSKKKIVPVDEEGKIVMSLEPHFSGYVYAKPKDMATNEATEFTKSDKITIDKTTPTVTIEPSRQPEFGKWYDDKVDINLTARQAVAGLSKVTIKVNDEIVQEINYSDNKSLDQDLKTYTIHLEQAGAPTIVEIIVIDNSGNRETGRKEVFIDNTVPQNPVAKAKIYDPNYVPPEKVPDPQPPVPDANGYLEGKKDYTGQWINMPVNVEISGDLSIPSGFAYYEYRTSEKGTSNWSDWETISNLPAKTHTENNDQQNDYQFRGVSNVGNISAPSETISLKIDKTIPENANISISGTPTADFWYKSSPDIVITSPKKEDRTQSPITTYYQLKNSVTGAVYKEGHFVESTIEIGKILDGEYTLDVYTVDEAGNASLTHETRTIKIASQELQILASAIQFEKTTPEQILNDYPHGVYSEEAVKAVIDTTQSSGSKVKNILYYYSSNPGNILSAEPDTDGKVTLIIAPYFNGKLMVKAVNYAGNEQTEFTLSKDIGLENNVPVITFNVEAPNADGWYSKNVNVETSVTDADSGLYEMIIAQDGKDPATTQFLAERVHQKIETIHMTKNGVGVKVAVDAKDNAANTSRKELLLNIDTRVPVLNAEIDNIFSKENVAIHLSGEVGISNIKKITMRKDNGEAIDITGVMKTNPKENGYLDMNGQYIVYENGNYTFELTNYAGAKTEETCEVTGIDKTAPAKPEYTINAVEPNTYVWYVSTPTINVVPPKQDGQSKITTYYKLYRPGTGDTQEVMELVKNQIEVTENGRYNFALWSSDQAGNISVVSAQEIWVDTTDPEFTVILAKSEDTYNNEAAINFNLKDEDSSPWYIEYSLQNKDGSPSKTNYVTPDKDGNVTIYAFGNFEGKVIAKGYDRAGNKVLGETKDFKVTTTKSTTQAIARDDYRGAWINKDVIYDISVKKQTEDLGNFAIRGYQVSFDNQNWYDPGAKELENYGTLVESQDKKTAVYTAHKDQNQTYYFRVLTSLTQGDGNVENREGIPDGPYTIRRDTGMPKNPTMTFDRSPEKTVDRDGETYQLYGEVTLIEVTGEDNEGGSGIAKKQYRLDQEVTWSDYVGKIILNPQYSGELSIRTIDKAGNISEVMTQYINVDRIEPEAPVVIGATGDNWSDKPVDLQISGGGSEDPTFSGIAYYEYSIDGGKTFKQVDATGVLPVTEDGETTYIVRAVSNTLHAGKTTTVIVKIDQSPLDLQVVAETDMKNWKGPDGWTNTAMRYVLSTSYTGPDTPVYYVKNHEDTALKSRNLNDTEFTKLDGNVFETTADGERQYEFIVKAGAKTTEPQILAARVDQKNPEMPMVTIADPDGEEGWYKTAPMVDVSHSGKDEDRINRSPILAYYALSKDQVEGSFSAIDQSKPQITEEGMYVLNTYGKDSVNNASSISAKMIKLDQSKPEIISIETYAKEEEGIKNDYAKITAKDNLSGVKNSDYYMETLSGIMSPIQTIQSNESGETIIKLVPGFDGYLYAKARDKAGNTSTEYTKSERITIKIVSENSTNTNTVITQLSKNVKTGVQSDAFSILLAIIMIAGVGAYFSSKKRNND